MLSDWVEFYKFEDIPPKPIGRIEILIGALENTVGGIHQLGGLGLHPILADFGPIFTKNWENGGFLAFFYTVPGGFYTD